MKEHRGTSEAKVPADLREALSVTPKAKIQWKDLTPIARRDFVSWIASAKQSETRKRRIEIACEKLVAGERRPCCYAVVPLRLYKALAANPKAKSAWSGLTPAERRDVVGWIDAAGKPGSRDARIEKVCARLAARKR